MYRLGLNKAMRLTATAQGTVTIDYPIDPSGAPVFPATSWALVPVTVDDPGGCGSVGCPPTS